MPTPIPVKATSAQLLGVRTEDQKGSDSGTRPNVLAGKSKYSSDISGFLKELFKTPWTGTVKDPTKLSDWKDANTAALEWINDGLEAASVPVELETSESGGSYTEIRNAGGDIIGHIATVWVLDTTGGPLVSNTGEYGILYGYVTIAIGKA